MAVLYNSNYDVTINFSDTALQLTLAADTEQTYQIPGIEGTKLQALFSYVDNESVFVGLNKTAAIPASGQQTTTQFLEHKPDKRFVSAGDTLHFISPDTDAHVGVTFRSLT